MTKRMPHAGLQIASLDTLAASDGLATGAVDAAMAPAPAYPPQPGMYGEVLYEDESVLLVHRTHRAPGRLSPAQFNALRHVDTWLVLGKPGLGQEVLGIREAIRDDRRVIERCIINRKSG